MTAVAQERPCIHVCLLGGVAEDLYRWVEVGAEEEGVPTQKIEVTDTEAVPAAYTAAQTSRFDIGVSITPGQVVLHEMHMPPHQPVLSVETGANARHACRRMGSNAARMVVRLPLRLEDEVEPPARQPGQAQRPAAPRPKPGTANPAPAQPPDGELSALEVKVLARIIARILQESGVS